MSRTATLDAFREGRITLLAASDVAARGLDIPDVSHIFNFDVPWQSDDYVHRIGRTGRAGKEGRSLTLVTPDDIKQLKDIEKMLGAPVTWIGDPPERRGHGERPQRPRTWRARGRPRPDGHEARGGGAAGLRSAPSATARTPAARQRPQRSHEPQPMHAAPEPMSPRASARAGSVAAVGHRHEEPARASAADTLRRASAPSGRGEHRRPQRGDRAARPEQPRAASRAASSRRQAQRQPWEPRAPRPRPRPRRSRADSRRPRRSRAGIPEEDHAPGAIAPRSCHPSEVGAQPAVRPEGQRKYPGPSPTRHSSAFVLSCGG